MIIKAKELKFKSDKITYRPLEYIIKWENDLENSMVMITRQSSLDGLCRDNLTLSGEDIPKFIKELQTLMEFMKNDGLLVEDEEEEAKDEDR